MTKLDSKQLRNISLTEAQVLRDNIKRQPIYLILENVYDTYNIGGLFRLADALTVTKIFLCGQMEIPPNHKIKKASVGTYKIVPWTYKKTTIEAIRELRNEIIDIQIVAIEQSENSISYKKAKYTEPLALIVGNETFGVLPETLDTADQIVEIPMWGINKSLNVIVSAAIVAYHISKSDRF